MKTFVLLGCERSGHWKYKHEVDVIITSSRMCGCPFKLRGKLVSNGEGWVLKIICGLHNHALFKTLVGHLMQGD